MLKNTINQEKCKKCGLCIEVCPVNMIEIDANKLVNFIPEREKICLECGQCMAICTTNAIKISKYTYEDNFIKLPENNLNYERYIDFISTRRSIRNFKNKQVETEIIEKALASLDFAPYGAEPNKVEITVVNNRKKIEMTLPAIEKFLDDIVKWVDSPFISRIIKHKKGIETFNTLKNHLYPMSKLGNYKLKYGDRITRGAPALIIFHADNGAEEHTDNSLIYSVYTMFALHSLGLGSLMNGIIPAAVNKEKVIKQMFEIPEQNEAVIAILFGYPKFKYNKTVKREGKKVNWIS